MKEFLIIALVVLGTVMLASILEGLLHQFILHTGQKKFLFGWTYGAYHAHAIVHHPAYREENYHREAPDEENLISLGWYTLPITLAVTSPVTALVWWWLGMGAGLAVPVTLSVYYASYEFLHWHMHFPRSDGKPRWYHAWPPSLQLFRWFDKRHYIHHIADDRNFNVVIPVYDLLTGRYTTIEDRIPWAVRARKARAVRRSEHLRRQHGKSDRPKSTSRRS